MDESVCQMHACRRKWIVLEKTFLHNLIQWCTVGFQSGPLVSNMHTSYTFLSQLTQPNAYNAHIMLHTGSQQQWRLINNFKWDKCRVNFSTWSVKVISYYTVHCAHSRHSKMTTRPKQQNCTNAGHPHTPHHSIINAPRTPPKQCAWYNTHQIIKLVNKVHGSVIPRPFTHIKE